MNAIKFYSLVVITLFIMQACKDEVIKEQKIDATVEVPSSDDTLPNVDTRGFDLFGNIIGEYDCPDSKFFPPIDVKHWNEIPVVNGRLPTHKETIIGSSILTYGGTKNDKVKVCDVTLPKLAYKMYGPFKTGFDPKSKKEIQIPEIVVVVEMVESKTDTFVGFRYLTGGVGGSYYRNFKFLSDEEIMKLKWK